MDNRNNNTEREKLERELLEQQKKNGDFAPKRKETNFPRYLIPNESRQS
jgi:hypothetical protein